MIEMMMIPQIVAAFIIGLVARINPIVTVVFPLLYYIFIKVMYCSLVQYEHKKIQVKNENINTCNKCRHCKKSIFHAFPKCKIHAAIDPISGKKKYLDCNRFNSIGDCKDYEIKTKR